MTGVETKDLEGGGSVISVSGELEAGAIAGFEAELDAAIGSGQGLVVVDLSACGFVDSTGLAAILHGAKRLASGDGELVLVGAEAEVLKLFRLTGIDQTVTLLDSLGDVPAWREKPDGD